jgi:hypothetical protein
LSYAFSLTLPAPLTIVSHMHNQELPDLGLIKRHAKTRSKEGGGMTYMQCLDQAARELYGLRHFHEARARVKHAASATHAMPIAASPLQYYLRTVQEYYLDF